MLLFMLFNVRKSQLPFIEDHWLEQEGIDGLQGDLAFTLLAYHVNSSCEHVLRGMCMIK